MKRKAAEGYKQSISKEYQTILNKKGIKDIIVTDDTGLCVECLNGEPGIYSGRYASKDMINESWNRMLLSSSRPLSISPKYLPASV